MKGLATAPMEDILSSHQELLNNEQLIVTNVRQWAGDNTDAILDPQTLFFTAHGIPGFIGYRLKSQCAVVIGEPTCPNSDKVALAKAFHADCKNKGLSIVYVSASKEFADLVNPDLCPISIEWGEKLIMDPHQNPYDNKGSKGSLVRRKVKQAIREGTTIVEYIPSLEEDPELEKAIEEVGFRWLKGRDKPQVHISQVDLFNYRSGKRWMYAKRQDKIVGVIVLNKIEAYSGWLINHLMINQTASNGTTELLVYTALNILAGEGCHFVTFGATPIKELKKIKGLGFIAQIISRCCYKVACKIFHLDGLKMFWGKFQPQTLPSYLLFSDKTIKPKALLSLMKALNVSMKK